MVAVKMYGEKQQAWQGYQPQIHRGPSPFQNIGAAYRDAIDSIKNRKFNNYTSPEPDYMPTQVTAPVGQLNSLDWFRQIYRQERPYG